MAPREFDLVIGADGTRSNIRRLVFGEDTSFVREYGTYFCLFLIPNIFDLDLAEIVYNDAGKLVAAYAAKEQSFACLAFKSKQGKLPHDNLKPLFEQEFKDSNWEVPRLLYYMKESQDCYFSTIAQVRMSSWSKGRVALVGDAAHAASEIGMTLAIVSISTKGVWIEVKKVRYINGIPFPDFFPKSVKVPKGTTALDFAKKFQEDSEIVEILTDAEDPNYYLYSLPK